MNKIIFLDRDGVINFDHGDYTWKKEQFSILPGILDCCLQWQDSGYKIIIITNQGGIAKGIYSHEEVAILHDLLIYAFRDAGVAITEIYYCPHHENFGKCLCRKPESIMIEKSLARFSAYGVTTGFAPCSLCATNSCPI